MRYSRWASAIIGLSVLCLGSCSTSRTAVSKSEQLNVERVELRDSTNVESVVVLDTLREITTITIDRNDKGDTLKVTQITDRTRATNRERAKDVEVKIVEKTDTVYIAVSDSVMVSSFRFQDSGTTEKKSNFVSSLKWIFWILCVIVVLIIAVRFGLRRSLF